MFIKSVSLYCNKDKHDKVYHAQVLGVEGNKYIVSFQYGARGKKLIWGTKCEPTSQYNAISIFENLIREKKKKGYHEIDEDKDLLMQVAFTY
jgi:hypothetical protein